VSFINGYFKRYFCSAPYLYEIRCGAPGSGEQLAGYAIKYSHLFVRVNVNTAIVRQQVQVKFSVSRFVIYAGANELYL
jgi:hypothetical protein